MPQKGLASVKYFSGYMPNLNILPCINPLACRLKVRGEGRVKSRPDMAEVILGVTTEDMQLQVAQQDNAQRINSVINTLTQMGIPGQNIQTRSYIIDPQYDFIEGKQVFRGYRVVHNLEVKIENTEVVGRVIDEAVKSGANTVSSINFSFSDASLLYGKALEIAVSDAIEKSRILGRKLNVFVSRVPVQIIEESLMQNGPITPFMSQVAGVSTVIQPGEIEVTARVEAIFTYTPSNN